MYIKVMHKIYLIAKRFFLRVKILREKNSVSPLDSSLNFSSNSGEKSYFAIWLNFGRDTFWFLGQKKNKTEIGM